MGEIVDAMLMWATGCQNLIQDPDNDFSHDSLDVLNDRIRNGPPFPGKCYQ